jgi:hypothetical protein
MNLNQENKTKVSSGETLILCEELGNQRIAQKGGVVRNSSHDSRARRRTLLQWKPRKF